MERVVSLVIGYTLGLIQTGYFYGKFHGVDLRKHGSGNSGATNTLRVMGKTAGLIVLFGDLMKSFAACLIVRLLFGSADPEMTLLYVLYAGAGAVLGHDFPFYLKFKGGKGVASTSGMIIALLDIRIFLICLAVFAGTVFLTRYVSLGSMLGAITFFLSWTYITWNKMNVLADSCRLESCILVFLVAALAIERHKANIGRLLAGKENKLGAKKAS